jgi:hypothetical protein
MNGGLGYPYESLVRKTEWKTNLEYLDTNVGVLLKLREI